MAASAPVTFAQLLRMDRTKKQWTQPELAEFARVGANTISELERSVILAPRRDTVERLAEALGLDPDARAAFKAAAREGALADGHRAAGIAASMRALPRDIGSFTGRAAELGLVIDKAEEGGVAGIHVIGGMAGVGKTAFAVHAAHRIAGMFPDGQVFLPLHGHDPRLRPVSAEDALESLLLTNGVSAGEIPPDLDGRSGLWR